MRGKYRDVILPMTVIPRLDAVLEDNKEKVLEMKKRLDDAKAVEQDAALRQEAGEAFYNTTKFTMWNDTWRAIQANRKVGRWTYINDKEHHT